MAQFAMPVVVNVIAYIQRGDLPSKYGLLVHVRKTNGLVEARNRSSGWIPMISRDGLGAFVAGIGMDRPVPQYYHVHVRIGDVVAPNTIDTQDQYWDAFSEDSCAGIDPSDHIFDGEAFDDDILIDGRRVIKCCRQIGCYAWDVMH